MTGVEANKRDRRKGTKRVQMTKINRPLRQYNKLTVTHSQKKKMNCDKQQLAILQYNV